MAVAAADFYTYARATGTPLPNSKKEEAQLAPAVDKWKKSRLSNRNASEENNLSDTTWYTPGEAAGVTAALAGIGAGVVAARNPATRQRIAQILRPNVPVNEPEAVAKVVEQVTPKAGTGVSTDVGGITQDLNVDLSSTPATPIAKTWVEQKARQTPQRATVVPKVTPQPEVATVVPKVSEQPQVTSQQALDDYTQKWINENSTSKQNISSLQEGIRQEKLASGDKEISRGYFESDAKRQQEQIANRGFNETDLPELPDQPAPGAPLADDPASYNPRTYIESTGAIAPKTQNIVSSPTQFSKGQLSQLEEYADTTIDAIGDQEFIPIQQKLDDYLEGRTDVYPLTQQDIQKFDNSFTDLKRTDPGAMDRELEVLSSDVGVNLGRKPTEYTRQDINLEDQRLYEIETQGSSNIQQPGIFSDDPELNPKGYKYSSEEGVTQVTPSKEQTFLAQEIQAQPAQPVTLTDVAKTDDLVVSQQSIENSNLNLNANANTGVQIGLDPEVSKVASSPINQNTVNTATSAQEFLNNERLEIASQLGEQNLPMTAARVEQELSNRLGPKAYTYGPEYTKVKQDIQIGATYDPEIFTNPDLQTVKIAGGYEVPVTDLKQPTVMPATAKRLQQRVENQKDWLGKVRLEATSNMRGLEQQAKQIKEAQVIASNRGDQRTVNQLEVQLNKLRSNYQTQQRRITGATKSSEKRISKMQLPLRLKPGIEEGQRVFAELDAAGQPIPGTQEIRSERIMVNTPTKGGGGRKVADYSGGGITDESVREIQTGGLITTPERTRQTTGRYRDYNPETGGAPQASFQDDSLLTGSKKDIYGIRLASEKADDPTKRPRVIPPSKTPLDLTKQSTPEGKRAMAASEEIRKIYSSGRPDAQQQVANYIQQLRQKGI
jgi:hypothetical protein